MAGFLKPLCLAVFASASLGLASPHRFESILGLDDYVPEINSTSFSDGVHSKRAAGDFELRIMPLGASIMSGVGSPDRNGGARRYLRAALRKDGWQVNMVGNQHTGNMKDNDHEAVPGDVIDQVHERFKRSAEFKPNAVIINAGFNDATRGINVHEAGVRMESMLSSIWGSEGMRSSCVFLSTLMFTTDPTGDANRLRINNQYRQLVAKRVGQGDCIYLVELSTPQIPSNGLEPFIYPDMYSDSVHPNNKGHKLLAAAFYQAINKAHSDKKLKPTSGGFEVSTGVCDKNAGSGIDAGGLTQRGSGADDDIYYHDSEELEDPWVIVSDWDRNQWRFARLLSPDYDDFVAALDNDDDDDTDNFVVWFNTANKQGNFNQAKSEMKPNLACSFDRFYFLDMNADGLDDFVCVYGDGQIKVSINKGNGNRDSGTPPSFSSIASEERPAGDVNPDRVILGDIDGDGRGDYGVLQDDNSIKFWRNDGVGDQPRRWQALGTRVQPRNVEDTKGYRLDDLNGDGRDDLLFVNKYGRITTWTNARSCQKGKEGDGLNVAWRQGFFKGQVDGPTHYGLSESVSDSQKDARKRFHLARIFGDKPIVGNLPKQDYIYLEHEKVGSKHHHKMRVWRNKGYGGTKLLADGNKYCNMMGHANGAVDYVWVWGGGMMELWASRGKTSIANNDPEGWWDYQEYSGKYMWEPPNERTMSRRDLHLADWDGDGRCDIIYVDPDNGAVEVWINEGQGKPTFSNEPLRPSVLRCDEKNGLGIHDIAVRFADLTGNGKADYLCMAPDARTKGFIHENDGSFTDVGQIKMPDGYDRANYQWSDVNGDGKDDLIWVEKFSGDGYVWYNEKRGNPGEFSGSALYWRRQAPPDVAYAGQVAGTCEYFVDMDGNGRADIHSILGTFTNEAKTSLAPACGLTDTEGDDAYEQLPPPPYPDTDNPGNPDQEYCKKGRGPGVIGRLCQFTCNFGFCPPPCECDEYVTRIEALPTDLAGPGTAARGPYQEEAGKLCDFACRKLFCPLDLCVPQDHIRCDIDISQQSGWVESRALDMIDAFMTNFGTNEWLREMHVIWALDDSDPDCHEIGGECLPGDCVQSLSTTYWYVRQLAYRIQRQFEVANTVVTDKSIQSIGRSGSMVADFESGSKDDGLLSQVFGGIGAGFSIAGGLASTSAPAAGTLLGITGTIFGQIGSSIKPSEDIDFDKIELRANRLAADVIQEAGIRLNGTLKGIFARGEEYSHFVTDLVQNYQPHAPGINDIMKLLYAEGLFLKEVTDDDNLYRTSLVKAYGHLQAAVLGSVLAGSHYHVVAMRTMTEAQCAKSKVTRWGRAPAIGHQEAEACLWLVYRGSGNPSKDSDSVTVSESRVKRLENPSIGGEEDEDYGYDINLKDLVENVAACRNGVNNNNNNQVYEGTGYPPCFFGITYVDAEDFFKLPIHSAVNEGSFKDQLPGWLEVSENEWPNFWVDPGRLLCDDPQFPLCDP